MSNSWDVDSNSEAIEAPALLFETLNKPDQAAEWKAKLEAFSLPATFTNSLALIPS